ncbi:MAG: hypothetical protein K6G64_02185 [Eubacterium sp.]|nr:hypothetical protein [Eubacterium sp.]
MVIEKKKMKGLCIYGFVLVNFVSLIIFFASVLGVILADKIHIKLLFVGTLFFVGIIGCFLIYYNCLITIYKAKYEGEMLVLSSLLKKYYVKNRITIKTETIKNYYLQCDNRKLIFPKYNIMLSEKDRCFSMKEILTIISWSTMK